MADESDGVYQRKRWSWGWGEGEEWGGGGVDLCRFSQINDESEKLVLPDE